MINDEMLPENAPPLAGIDAPVVEESNPQNVETPILSVIATFIVILVLAAGGYGLFRHYSKSHNLPSAMQTLDSAVNQNQAPQ